MTIADRVGQIDSGAHSMVAMSLRGGTPQAEIKGELEVDWDGVVEDVAEGEVVRSSTVLSLSKASPT